MNIPTTVKVGSQRIKVLMIDSLPGDNLGMAKQGVGKIEVSKTCRGEVVPEDSLADTFLHEIIHVVSGTYGIGLKENQVSGLAGGLLQVIRDNGLDFRRGDMAKGVGKKKGKKKGGCK